jgi:DNA invertase Pin-like site-specific DNA recombinase
MTVYGYARVSSESQSSVLGGLAEFERHLIIARTGEGRVGAPSFYCASRRTP